MIDGPQTDPRILAGVAMGEANASLVTRPKVLSSATHVSGDSLSSLRADSAATVFTRSSKVDAHAQSQGLRGELVRAETMLQIAQEAFTAVEVLVGGMQQLAAQGLDENLDDNRRVALNDSFQELKQDISDIVNATVFDGESILKGGDGPNGEYVLTLPTGGESGGPLDILIPTGSVADKIEGFADTNLLKPGSAQEAAKQLVKAGQIFSDQGDLIESQRDTLQEIYAAQVDTSQTLDEYVATFESPKYAEGLAVLVKDIVLASGEVPFQDSADRLRDVVVRFLLQDQPQTASAEIPTTPKAQPVPERGQEFPEIKSPV